MQRTRVSPASFAFVFKPVMLKTCNLGKALAKCYTTILAKLDGSIAQQGIYWKIS